MKKILSLLAASLLLFAGCNKSANDEKKLSQEDEVVAGRRNCSSYDVLLQQLKDDPSLARRMDDIEAFTKNVIANPTQFRMVNGVIEIPVVFNVLYRTSAENITEPQLDSQIDVLNEDFSATNADYNTTTTYNEVKAGYINIRFVKEKVVRKYTSKTSWRADDAMKKSNRGGIDPTTPTTHLNIWVCNMSGGILGYAQFPGGNPATDGIVLDNNATGRTGTAAYPFDKGRTATHEVGHWLNLRHIWGDATCGNDFVDDTPRHNAANYGCPAAGHMSTCTPAQVEMTMNYMDYTDDRCMYMFSAGQKARMLALFNAGGARYSFAQ